MSRPPRKQDPRELMEQALRLISKELDQLETLAEAGKLEGDAALTLVRYSDSLLKYVKDGITQEDEEKTKLAKMSTADLAKLAESYANAAKEKAKT